MRRFPSSTEIELPCPHCGYDLRGLVRRGRETSARCPECGRECTLWEMHAARLGRRMWVRELIEPPLWLVAGAGPFFIFWLLRVILKKIEISYGTFTLITLSVGVYIAFYTWLLLRRLEIEFGEYRNVIILFAAVAAMLNLVLVRMMVVLK